MPADRLLEGNDAHLEDVLLKEKLLRVYIDPVSNAKLTYALSLVVLDQFVSCLVSDLVLWVAAALIVDTVQPDASSPPEYIMRAEHGLYTCEVVLPGNSPVHSAVGKPSIKKAIAKRSAAFEACVLLRQKKHLDENFLSTHRKYLPSMRNAHLALNVRQSSSYDMKIKPEIWQQCRGSLPKFLFMTILRLEKPEHLGRKSRPIGLLTRMRLPDLPSVLLHLQIDKKSDLIFHALDGSFDVTPENLSRLNSFTLRIYKDVFNKKFEIDEPAMSYWFAPVVEHYQPMRTASAELIDWPVVDYVFENEAWIWEPDCPHEELQDRYLVDKWDGGRRFFSIRVVPELRPQDPVPAGTASHRYMNSILDYTVSLFSKSRKNVVWRQEQPVIYARKILHRLNWLDEYTEKERNVKTDAYVVPEPLLFSAVSPRYWYLRRRQF